MWYVVCLSLECPKTEISTLNLIRNYAIKCGSAFPKIFQKIWSSFPSALKARISHKAMYMLYPICFLRFWKVLSQSTFQLFFGFLAFVGSPYENFSSPFAKSLFKSVIRKSDTTYRLFQILLTSYKDLYMDNSWTFYLFVPRKFGKMLPQKYFFKKYIHSKSNKND